MIVHSGERAQTSKEKGSVKKRVTIHESSSSYRSAQRSQEVHATTIDLSSEMKKSETCPSEAPESPEKTVPKPCEFLSQSKLLSSTQPVSSANLGVRQSLDHPKLSSLLSQTHRKATFQAVLGAATQ